MTPFKRVRGAHSIVTLDVPGRERTKILCLIQKDANGRNGYYVLAECEGNPLRWRSMIRDNSIRRLRDEFVVSIVNQEPVDALDVETIFICSAEASKT